MPGPIADAHTDTHTDAHTDAHTDRIIYPDAERVTDQGANMDRIPNDLMSPVSRAVTAWDDTPENSAGERDAERDLICACRDLLAYVDGEQQRDADAERERDADEPDPEWVTELVANVRRAADAAERIAERLYSHQPEPDPDSEFDTIRRAYRLGWDTGAAAAKHRSQ